MKSIKVETWLPIFSGFYGTIWESDFSEECELHNINEVRQEKGLPEVDSDAVEFDYMEYYQRISEDIADDVSGRLEKMGLIAKYKFQKLSSPREYNFANDSIHVEYTLSDKNKKTIKAYLAEHSKAFEAYLKDHYTSYDGFCSFHSNNPADWTVDLDATLAHEHKLGAVLDFILRNEEGPGLEQDIYEDVTCNTAGICASNYDALVGVK